jgi:uncharacterized membrane protein YfcA
MSPTELSILAASGLIAGLMNAVAGGGSLITLPALMLMGIGAAEANATNRIAVAAQTLTATHGFHRAGVLPWAQVRRHLAPTAIGAGIGAWLATEVPDQVMEPLILGVLVTVGLVMVVPRGGRSSHEPSEAETHAGSWFETLLMGLTGLYGGFLQAGLGLVFLGALMGIIGLDPLRANGVKAALLMGLTAVALTVFSLADMLHWTPGLVVAGGSVIGSAIGVRVAVRWASLLRWMALGAVVLSALVIGLR